MAERREQEKPLSPFPPEEFTTRRRQRCLKCCGCSAALLLIIALTTLILMLTVFHVKDPTIELNSVKIDGLDLLSNNTGSIQRAAGLNLTLAAAVSVKNPNAASFKFHESTTEVRYGGAVVGEARTAAGEAGPRRRRRLEVAVDVMVDRLVGVSRYESDFGKGVLPISTYTRLEGMVKITEVIKRAFLVKIECTINVDLRSQDVQDRNCI